jgi:hypothetical protein
VGITRIHFKVPFSFTLFLAFREACKFVTKIVQKSFLLAENFCEFSRGKTKIKRTINLPVVFYACKTWSLILREEHKLRAFEKRVLGKTFCPKRDEVTGE